MAITNLTDYLKSIADSIRAKKGTTAPINAQNFASEIESISGGTGGATLKGGWTGTAVPVDTTTTIGNIYLNKQLSTEEVINLLNANYSLYPSITYDNVNNLAIVYADSMSVLSFVAQQGSAMIGDLNMENVYFIYIDGSYEIEMLGFSGWNPDFNGTLAVNGTGMEGMIPLISAEGNEKLKSLFSITPFEKLNIPLSGTYTNKTLTITENGSVNVLNDITNNKEITTSVNVDILDYKAGLFGYDLPEEIVLESYSSGLRACLFDYGISSDKYFSYLLKFTPTLKKLTINTDIGNSDFKLAQNCFHLETLVFNFKKDSEIRAKGLLKCENVFGLKTLIVDCTDTLETMWFLSLNTFLKDCCYFNGTTKNNVFDITYTKGGWSMGTTTYSINPNAEKTGVIYVSDNIYDYVIADEENSNYVSQIKKLSEYVEE